MYRSSKSGADAVRIRLVSQDAALVERLKLGFVQDPRFDLDVDPRSILEASATGDIKIKAAALVVDANLANAREVEALEKFALGANGAPIIVISGDLGGETTRRLLHLKIADWLPRQTSADELRQACERAIRDREPAERAGTATCYAFYPVLGGVGNTTLAAATAFLLGAGKRESRKSVCLVDLDFQSGALADYLDLLPNMQLDDIADAPERLDNHLLEVLISRHASGPALLAAPNSLDGSALNPKIVARLLDLAATKFESLVVDMPRVWLPWSEGVLRGANRFFLVTELSVPGLRQARRIADELRRRFNVDMKGRIIVNKVGWLGAHGMRKSDAYEALGDLLAGFVRDAGTIPDEARNRGVPISEIRRESRIEKDLKAILNAGA